MFTKNVYLIVGPESAGNRLMTALLIRAGCEGVASVHQKWEVPEHQTSAVMLRSYPHGTTWPDLRDLVKHLRDRKYVVRVLVMTREHHALINSQVARHGYTKDVAEANVRKAYELIFWQLSQVQVRWEIVEVEMLQRPRVLDLLLMRLDLAINEGPLTVEGETFDTVYDSNDKWY